MSDYGQDDTCIYIESSEDDLESRLILKTPDELDGLLASLGWDARKAQVLRLAPLAFLAQRAKDPAATALVLIKSTLGSVPMGQTVALSLLPQIGLGAVAAILIEVLKTADPGAAFAISAEAFVRLLVQTGQVTWTTPDTMRLRDRLLEMGAARAYLEDPTLNVNALLAIWSSTRLASHVPKIGSHPNATEEFWHRALDLTQASAGLWGAAYGCARARKVPEVREQILKNVVDISAFQSCLDTPGASSELLAFGLEGLYRREMKTRQTIIASVLSFHIKRMAEDGRLDGEVLSYLCQSPEGAVRQWAQLSLASKTKSETPPLRKPRSVRS